LHFGPKTSYPIRLFLGFPPSPPANSRMLPQIGQIQLSLTFLKFSIHELFALRLYNYELVAVWVINHE